MEVEVSLLSNRFTFLIYKDSAIIAALICLTYVNKLQTDVSQYFGPYGLYFRE